MQLSTVQKNGLTVYYRTGTADEQVIKQSFENDLFLKGVPEYTIAPHHTIIDIGAHIGCFTMMAAKMLTHGKIFALEPSQETYQVLQQNIDYNKLNNTSIIKKAVAGATGSAVLFHDIETGNWGHTITKSISEQTELIETISLSDVILQNNLNTIDFIKFNCEGAEFDILLNAPIALLQRVNNILVLYHMDLAENFHYNKLVNHLSAAGFKIHIRNQDNKPPRGWIIAYRANSVKNIFITITTFPLQVKHFLLKIARRIRNNIK